MVKQAGSSSGKPVRTSRKATQPALPLPEVAGAAAGGQPAERLDVALARQEARVFVDNALALLKFGAEAAVVAASGKKSSPVLQQAGAYLREDERFAAAAAETEVARRTLLDAIEGRLAARKRGEEREPTGPLLPQDPLPTG